MNSGRSASPSISRVAVSFAGTILGWLGALPLLVINYQYIGGATAGVGLLGPFLLGLLSATLCLLGVIFGVVALARIRSGAAPWPRHLMGGDHPRRVAFDGLRGVLGPIFAWMVVAWF